MSTPTSFFDYELPHELIAQHSIEPRDHSRLMFVDRKTGRWQHKVFYEILNEFYAGDVLVMNNTKVFRARLQAVVHGRRIELFLLRPREDGVWDALVKPGKYVSVGDIVELGEIRGEVLSKTDIVQIRFNQPDTQIIEYANIHGEIPIPPYVEEIPLELDQYQTVYAQETGSVAAPTAGFHFTKELLEKIQQKGIEIHYVTLHVGLGTFRPMKSDTIEEHQMHSEFVSIDSNVAQAINQAKEEGRRVIAVGTTTVRTLEGVVAQDAGMRTSNVISVLPSKGFSGDINIFITPGFRFRVVDALITNFHLPKSTLLVLVSAFAGREQILTAYQEAVHQNYRFFSFGDAMFIS